MAVRVYITIDEALLDAALKRVTEVADDPEEMLGLAATIAEEMVSERFKAEGPGWAKLKPATLARRRLQGRGAQILDDTGRLRASIVPRVIGHFVEIGSNLVYAATHQYGRGPIPARPFLPEPDEVITELLASRKIERYVRDKLEGA